MLAAELAAPLHPGGEEARRRSRHRRRPQAETAGPVGGIVLVTRRQIGIDGGGDAVDFRCCRRAACELDDIAMAAQWFISGREDCAHRVVGDRKAGGSGGPADCPVDLLAVQVLAESRHRGAGPPGDQEAGRVALDEAYRIAEQPAP